MFIFALNIKRNNMEKQANYIKRIEIHGLWEDMMSCGICDRM